MDLPLTIILRVEQVRKFRFDILVVIIPRAGRGSAFAPLPLYRITDINALLPRPKANIEPVLALRRL